MGKRRRGVLAKGVADVLIELVLCAGGGGGGEAWENTRVPGEMRQEPGNQATINHVSRVVWKSLGCTVHRDALGCGGSKGASAA